MNEDWTEAHDEVLESIEETLDIKLNTDYSLLGRLKQIEEQLDFVLDLAAGAHGKLDHVFKHLVRNMKDD